MRTLLLGFCLLLASAANAGVEFRAQGNIHEVKADEVNQYFTGQSLKEIHRLPGLKLDIGFNPLSRLFFGLRIANSRLHLGDGTGGISGDTNYSKIVYESYGPYMRLYLIDSKFMRFDIFGGAGGARVMVTAKQSGVEQTQGLKENDLRFMQWAGGSLSLGIDKFSILFEGGYEWARFNSLSYSTSANPHLQMVDLNGPYVGIGVAFKYDGSSSLHSR